MCTYITNKIDVQGSAKGGDGWFTAKEASVYLDHPVHAPYTHSLNIDFLNQDLGPSFRVAGELNPKDAVLLARTILDTVEAMSDLVEE